MKKNKLIFTIFYVLVSTLILSLAVDNTLQKTHQYFDEIFSNISSRIKEVGQFNAYNAERIEKRINDGTIDELISDDDISLIIGYYSERDEYGFNQGIYPDTSPQGMLIGKGRPDSGVFVNAARFLFLDREWDYFDQLSIFNNHFLLNYQFNYIYLSYRIDNSFDRPLFDESKMTKESLRQQLNGTAQAQVEDKGYFYTIPYDNLFTGQKVVSVVSPIMSNDQHIADLGFNIELYKLTKTIELYPTLKNSVQLSIDFKYSDEEYVLSESKNNYWIFSSYRYGIKDFGYLVATYDVTLILREVLPIFFLIVFLYIMILLNYRRIKIENNIHEKIRTQLNLDAMTNLFNRRGLDKILQKDIPIYREKDELIFIIAIDADKFKQINDIHGHMIGDKALIFIAKAMTQCTRESDYCIRMGGDEFLIILPNSTENSADAVMNRIDSYLENFSKSEVGVKVTVSQAAVLFNSDERFDEAYRRVDELMYQKKESVKNSKEDL